jgi:hypothetical protein
MPQGFSGDFAVKLIGAAVIVMMLAACSATVNPGRTTVHVPGASITTGGGGHCPPGHAKKGWC